MMTSSITLGRIAGIRIGIHWSWLVVFGLITWSLATAVFPDQNPGLGDSHVHRDGRRRGGAVLHVAAPARARARVPGEARRNGDRRDHALALRRRRAVPRDVPDGGCGVPDRDRRAARLARARRRLRRARGRDHRRRGARRDRCVARLHQPRAARVQPSAGAAAGRRAGASVRALGRARRLRAGRRGSRRRSDARSARSSSWAGSRSSSARAERAGSGWRFLGWFLFGAASEEARYAKVHARVRRSCACAT